MSSSKGSGSRKWHPIFYSIGQWSKTIEFVIIFIFLPLHILISVEFIAIFLLIHVFLEMGKITKYL